MYIVFSPSLLSAYEGLYINQREGGYPNGLTEAPVRDGWHGTHETRHRVVVAVVAAAWPVGISRWEWMNRT